MQGSPRRYFLKELDTHGINVNIADKVRAQEPAGNKTCLCGRNQSTSPERKPRDGVDANRNKVVKFISIDGVIYIANLTRDSIYWFYFESFFESRGVGVYVSLYIHVYLSTGITHYLTTKSDARFPSHS